MDYVYIVRHHFKNDRKLETPENQDDSWDDSPALDDWEGIRKEINVENSEKLMNVSEWVFKSFDSAFNHAVEISLSLMGIDRHNFQDLDEVRMFKELSLIFKEEKDKPYKAIQVPCDTGKEELEHDLVEFHKVDLLD